VLQCVEGVLQRVAVCCSVLPSAAVCDSVQQCTAGALQCVTVRSRCVAVCCSVLQCAAVCCSCSGVFHITLKVCCSVLQCVAVPRKTRAPVVM